MTGKTRRARGVSMVEVVLDEVQQVVRLRIASVDHLLETSVQAFQAPIFIV